MKTESAANNILALQLKKKNIEKEIKKHVGIVPAAWYDELDQVEIQIMRASK